LDGGTTTRGSVLRGEPPDDGNLTPDGESVVGEKRTRPLERASLSMKWSKPCPKPAAAYSVKRGHRV
jgi:hypothetical protein